MWGTVAAAAASAFAAQLSERQARRLGINPIAPAGSVELGRLVEAHKARMAAMHRETMRGAQVGTALLLALAAVGVYGLLQLFGAI